MISSIGLWWARLFGRARRVTPERKRLPRITVMPALAPVAVASVSAAPMPAAAALTLPAERSTILVSPRESGPITLALPVDPQVRGRTMAALKNLRQIPALQSLAQGFTQAIGRSEVAIDEVVAAISKDSALCVRILGMANSVLVSPERRIEDLDTAVHMLGVVRVRKTAQALITLRDANRVADGFDWRHLWIHALATAAIAEELEQRLRSSGDPQLHLAALLHDVGKIVLSTVATDDYRAILAEAWNESGCLEDMERSRLGVDHREAGEMFARQHGLPALVVQAIAHHDRPEAAESHRFEVALVAIANHVSKAHGVGFSGSRLGPRDGEFSELPAWKVVGEERGGLPDLETLETELGQFVTGLRSELRDLRESA